MTEEKEKAFNYLKMIFPQIRKEELKPMFSIEEKSVDLLSMNWNPKSLIGFSFLAQKGKETWLFRISLDLTVKPISPLPMSVSGSLETQVLESLGKAFPSVKSEIEKAQAQIVERENKRRELEKKVSEEKVRIVESLLAERTKLAEEMGMRLTREATEKAIAEAEIIARKKFGLEV